MQVQKPVLVFVHGYGGTAAVYFELYNRLSEHFHCYFFDLIGIGLSSRITYKYESP